MMTGSCVDVGVTAAMTLRLLLLMGAWPIWAPGAATAAEEAGGWQLGRATYYAAPKQVVMAYDPTRGEGSFGILAYGACGYTNLPGGDLPFPREMYAAAADANSDYPGSCGRCYEIRCKPGLVLDNQGNPIGISTIKLSNGSTSTVKYFGGDYWRPYLASINASVPDDQGRLYPGNPAEAQGQAYTACYNTSTSLVVRVSDQCPCKQVLPAGAPGVAPGGETRRQEWCCGPLQHFDISYWAFEQLAHPVSGAMMLEWRPVDCDTRAPLPRQGYISSTLYNSSTSSGIQPGWGWYPYDASSALLRVPGAAPSGNGGLGSCVQLAAKGGGLSLRSREAGRPAGVAGPFAGKQQLAFAIRPEPPGATLLPSGGLKVFVMADEDDKKYCGAEPVLWTTVQPAQRQGGDWSLFKIPLSDFQCAGLVDLAQLNRIDIQNTDANNAASFCLTDVRLE